MEPNEPKTQRPTREVIIRDLIIFHIKLWLDGLKDIVLAPVSVGAGVLDLVFGPKRGEEYRLYRVLRHGERFDLWLNLWGAAEQASKNREGLFGASRSGDDTLLGQLEELSGGERPEMAGQHSAH